MMPARIQYHQVKSFKRSISPCQGAALLALRINIKCTVSMVMFYLGTFQCSEFTIDLSVNNCYISLILKTNSCATAEGGLHQNKQQWHSYHGFYNTKTKLLTPAQRIQSIWFANIWWFLLFKYNKCSYLQYQPQLVSTFHILLVVHPVEFDNIGVVRKSFEDVVLCLDFLINILKNRDTDQLT